MSKTDGLAARLEALASTASLTRPEHVVSPCRFEGNVWFVGRVSVEALERVIDEVWTADAAIRESAPRVDVQSRVVQFVNGRLQRATPVSGADVEALLASVPIQELRSWIVIRPIHGIRLGTVSPNNPPVFGPITIYDSLAHSAHLAVGPKGFLPKDIFFGNRYAIGTRITTRASENAIASADLMFRRVERALRYMLLRRDDHLDIGIYDYRAPQQQSVYAVAQSVSHTGTTVRGAIQPIDLTDPHFVDPTVGHDWLWAALGRSPLNELERKILAAVDWIGRAVRDPDPQDAFVQCIFAVEALLQRQSGPYSPSLTAHLAEATALILGKNTNERVQFEDLVRRLYGVRSSIVHAGGGPVSEADLMEALLLVKALVIELTTDPKLLTLNSAVALHEHLRAFKYR